jgi:hypothetical protein
LKRVRVCRRFAADSTAGVGIRLSGDRAGLSGVQTCGSVWACPSCAAKVTAHRAAEIEAVLQGHHQAGGRAVFATFTVSHHLGISLAKVWAAVSAGWGRVTSGREWVEDQAAYGISDWLRVVEVTHGANGWHVHVHALLFLTDVHPNLLLPNGRSAARLIRSGRRLREMEASLFGRWQAGVSAEGLTASRSAGVDIRPVHGAGPLGNYFSKAVYETTNAGGKKAKFGNATPFQLLRNVVEAGCADSLDAWHEYERVSKGKRQLTWSRGLRGKYLSGPELTDDQAAEVADLDGETVLNLNAASYRLAAAGGHVPVMLTLAETSLSSLWRYCDDQGIPYTVPNGNGGLRRAGVELATVPAWDSFAGAPPG